MFCFHLISDIVILFKNHENKFYKNNYLLYFANKERLGFDENHSQNLFYIESNLSVASGLSKS